MLKYTAIQHLLTRLASEKFRELPGYSIGDWRTVLKDWDPKRDFSIALLHAERLCQLLTDIEVVTILHDQAKRFPERGEVLERYLDQAEPRCRYLVDRITNTGSRLLTELAEPYADAAKIGPKMSASLRFLAHQKSPISAIIRLALSGKAKSAPADLFERRHTVSLAARADELVDAYLAHVQTPTARYPDTVPAHLFAQWGFAPMVQAIRGVPYPLRKALNGGCRLEINGVIPRGEPLQIQSRLKEIDDNGRRAILRVEVLTEPRPCLTRFAQSLTSSFHCQRPTQGMGTRKKSAPPLETMYRTSRTGS